MLNWLWSIKKKGRWCCLSSLLTRGLGPGANMKAQNILNDLQFSSIFPFLSYAATHFQLDKWPTLREFIIYYS
jgi:hypothetical protein